MPPLYRPSVPLPGPTMFDKLKNYELGMDPTRGREAIDALNKLMGRGTTDNLWEQGPTLQPDPDVEATAGTRRGLTPISLPGIFAQAVGRR